MRFTRLFVVSGLAVAVMALSAGAALVPTITLHSNVYVEGNPGADLKLLTAGDVVIWELAAEVIDDQSNMGLATIVYDIQSNAPSNALYTLDLATNVESGWSTPPVPLLREVTQGYYNPGNTTATSGYNGGWGFDTGGLPTGGNNTTSPGDLLGAGIAAPLSYVADQNNLWPGLQSNVRLGVGHGTYTFPADDLRMKRLPTGATIGGFGQNIDNGAGESMSNGDGNWIFQRGRIDTSGWADGSYNFDVIPSSGAVFSASLDYSIDHPGSFRVAIPSENMAGTSFNIRIPEPMTLSLLALGGLGLAAGRRRR